MTVRNTPPGHGHGQPAAEHGPKERIRTAAMELFAERGQRGPTLRAVGERADVSAGLVQHHYGTKKRLLAEVQDWVLAELAALSGGEAARPGASTVDVARYDEFLAANPVVAGYLRRRILESEPGEATEFFRDAVEYRRRTAGVVGTDLPDPEVVAAMEVLVAMAPMLLGPLLVHALGRGDAELFAQWRRVEAALLDAPPGVAG